MRTRMGRRAFVAVHVSRGVVYDVQAFQDEKSALRRAECWRRSASEEHDDIGVHKVIVALPRREPEGSAHTLPGSADGLRKEK